MTMSDFMNDLQSVINRHCQENQSGTPDFILASFVADSLKAFSVAVNDRERWYGRSQDQFGMTEKDEVALDDLSGVLFRMGLNSSKYHASELLKRFKIVYR
ncbi:hypothetical protein SEA_MRMIYAGI_108 [Mycobacterium phage MrMiyagi]|uniref:Uncharacterized protein n=1 Tax=Mycobacterium phage MrMiyagi TaxID=2762395 RepID=A0A7G8LPZ9_9CAUD|nr:hypothetical protein SEA_MRMIYAGI_108 [Mycobacterium phage MrMiyagi]